MGLFDKKFCDICGGKIGMLGNRKLDDGNMCGDCAKKLSPFFSERRQSTIADINNQLAYREANKPAVAAFNVTRTFGKGTKVFLDDNARKLIVTSSNKWQNENPDVIDFSQVSGCRFDVESNRREETYQKDGKTTSYVPPRYKDLYDFYITIYVNSPWFNEIKFRLNTSTIEQSSSAGASIIGSIVGGIAKSIEYKNYEAQAQEIKDALDRLNAAPGAYQAAGYAPQGVLGYTPQGVPGYVPQGAPPAQQGYPAPVQQAYQASQQGYQPLQQGYQAPQAQPTYPTQLTQQAYANPQAYPTQTGYPTQPAYNAAVICPLCGANTIPMANGCCEYCRAKIR